jgi:hypothetical protein
MLDIISVFGILLSLIIIIFLKGADKYNLYLSSFYFTFGIIALTGNAIIFIQNLDLLRIIFPFFFTMVLFTRSPFLFIFKEFIPTLRA